MQHVVDVFIVIGSLFQCRQNLLECLLEGTFGLDILPALQDLPPFWLGLIPQELYDLRPGYACVVREEILGNGLEGDSGVDGDE